jgi:hypothetical protein
MKYRTRTKKKELLRNQLVLNAPMRSCCGMPAEECTCHLETNEVYYDDVMDLEGERTAAGLTDRLVDNVQGIDTRAYGSEVLDLESARAYYDPLYTEISGPLHGYQPVTLQTMAINARRRVMDRTAAGGMAGVEGYGMDLPAYDKPLPQGDHETDELNKEWDRMNRGGVSRQSPQALQAKLDMADAHEQAARAAHQSGDHKRAMFHEAQAASLRRAVVTGDDSDAPLDLENQPYRRTPPPRAPRSLITGPPSDVQGSAKRGFSTPLGDGFLGPTDRMGKTPSGLDVGGRSTESIPANAPLLYPGPRTEVAPGDMP